MLSVSPDNMFELRRLPADSGERGEARKELEITVHGRVAYRWTSPIGATSVLWSPESKYLAVNDAPGVQGDQLRVFSLDPMNSSVTALREPNGEKLRTEVESRHGSFLSRVEGVSLRAMDWRQDRLWWYFYSKEAVRGARSVPLSLGFAGRRGRCSFPCGGVDADRSQGAFLQG